MQFFLNFKPLAYRGLIAVAENNQEDGKRWTPWKRLERGGASAGIRNGL
jgi:hypothetical protein